MSRNWFKLLSVLGVFLLLVVSSAYAYRLPEDYSNIKYFYVFGSEGSPLMGAEDNELEIYFEIPDQEAGDLLIKVFDPDTGGKRDWKENADNSWDTVTEFAVYGNKLLAEKQFSEGDYDYNYFTFGPYSADQGKKIDGGYQFKMKVRGLKGDDANLFKFKIFPKSAEAYSYNITMRLASNEGEEMYFYPDVPAGTKELLVENYDIDRRGGISVLYDPLLRTKYDINDSSSGEWSKTVVPVNVLSSRRFKYVITKGTQRSAHAALKIANDKGELLPIYFRKAPALPVTTAKALPLVKKLSVKRVPVEEPSPIPFKRPAPLKCNKFIFDATKSYDPDDQNLSFHWDFGDGVTSTESIITHAYDQGGEYLVALTVFDDSGLECNTDKITQKIFVNTAPRADFTVTESACINQKITLDASSTVDETPGDTVYSWDFGDGTTGVGKKVKKFYEKGGIYRVTLSVDDNFDTACSKDVFAKTVRINTPPVASAGEDVSLCLKSQDDKYKVKFNAGGSEDSDGNRLTYYWNFGDGTKAEGKIISHTYQKGGQYKVNLVVDDFSGTNCSVDSDSLVVNLNRVPLVNAGGEISACQAEVVEFSGSASSEDGCNDCAYHWNFGGGEIVEGLRAEHVYDKGGVYNVAFTADDGKGTPCSSSTDIVKVDINSSPSVSLKGSKLGCLDQTFSFDASSARDFNGDSLRYFWDFGDGTIREDKAKVTHKYSKGGRYKVKVTVNDQRNLPCSTASSDIEVRVNTAPVADAGPNLVCCQGKETVFDASNSYDPDGDKLTYSWNFGDGRKAKGVKVTHAYRKHGIYDVVLTVKDDSGSDCNLGTAGFTANVQATPVAVIDVRKK
ncbi:MAG: PKD domain-containing protein [Candidatus Omnitrophica bacterium]|nr:PKD domain-containing protein [Candidatus Omnitrophota bacterium]